MGQTLTHGIYLPDEGERNCYNGLAANWSILDGAVGTVAEHTTALAGKAPAVHTHTKSQITDFPAYGTTAGTICEGNDSRLSDARTPVAHTHTKSDVTDLLNSNFIPSANNSYDLGSSSYQWNNLYAKNYYYNGTAWGLDKENTWTNNNYFQGNVYQKSANTELVKGTLPSSVTYYGAFRHYTNSNQEMNLFRGYIGATGDNCFRWSVEPWVSGSNGRFQMRVSSDGTVRAFEVDGTEVSPFTNNTTDLGTSTNKWKSLNGINPGALSLPDYNSAAKLNFTSTFPAPDSSGNIFFTPPMSGWLYVYFDVTNATSSGSIFYAEIKDSNMNNANANAAQIFWRSVPAGDLPVFFPVIANKQFIIQINFTGYTVKKALIIPGMGHVA